MLFNLDFWKSSAERAVKTFAQTLLALVGTDSVNIMTVDLGQAVVASLIAAGLSVLTSVALPKTVAPKTSVTDEH